MRKSAQTMMWTWAMRVRIQPTLEPAYPPGMGVMFL